MKVKLSEYLEKPRRCPKRFEDRCFMSNDQTVSFIDDHNKRHDLLLFRQEELVARLIFSGVIIEM